MTVTLPEWLVGLAVALWCARCSVEWLLAWHDYRTTVERRRNRFEEAHRG